MRGLLPDTATRLLTAASLLSASVYVMATACDPKSPFALWIEASPYPLTLAVGEERIVDLQTNAFGMELDGAACAGIAEVTRSGIDDMKVRGLTPGSCSVTVKAARTEGEDEYEETDTKTLLYPVTVTPSDASAPADAGAEGGSPDASDPDAATPLCSVQVAHMGKEGDRDRYMAYTDVDSNPAVQACPIHPSTDWGGDLVFAFLSGSPGYSIDGRGNYKILTATGASIFEQSFSSWATALEGDVVTLTFQQRYPDPDAGPPATWTMTFRMAPDPDWAKWRVELFSFSKN